MGDAEREDEVFAAIAAPVRRQMLELMAGDELPAGSIAADCRLSLSAASQHLSVLLAAELVTVRRDGRQRLYRTNPDALRSVAEWVSIYVPFWTDRLNALKHHLDNTQMGIPDDHYPPIQP